MKALTIFVLGIAFAFTTRSQESRLTISGGYTFAKFEDTETSAPGFRINGLFEFKPVGSKYSHGFSFGYLGTSGEATNQLQTTEYKINEWPLYYAPKYYLGDGPFKGFVKGALGFHFSIVKRTTQASEIKGNDFGFYTGAGAGAMFETKKALLFNIEYEWAYLSNSFYRDGFVNSVMAGIGFKF